MRKEYDALGEMNIDDALYYGIQTHRAMNNFTVSGRAIGDYTSFINSLAYIKKAAALANNSLGLLTDAQCGAICKAADEVLQGKMAEQFPIDIFHGGGGTAANMNIDEVLANRASEILTGRKAYEPVHPNTHVNKGQSTNDVIPSAMKMAVHTELAGLTTSLEHALAVLREKEIAFKDTVTIGRTCVQDALPITFGQFFSGSRAALERLIAKTALIREELLELPMPGTAIGTCFAAAPGYAEALYPQLAKVTGVPFRMEGNLYDGLQNADIWMVVSGHLKAIGSLFTKISADLRLLSSGPRAGFNNLNLPAVQPGSSIMPGKVNPVMPEMMMQIGFKVFGNDCAVSLAADRGELELNVWESLILQCVMESIHLLRNGVRLFSDRCLTGITVNEEQCQRHAASSLALSTVLAVLEGYPFASEVAKEAAGRGLSIKDVVVEKGIMDQATAERMFDPMAMTDIVAFQALIDGYKK